MGKPNAIIHIGFNKCGSTAIQKWLAISKTELSRQGFLHKRTDPRPHVICSNPQYAVLAYSLIGALAPPRQINELLGFEIGNQVSQDKMAFAFRDKIEALATDNPDKTFIISSEYFVAEVMNEPEIKALVAWFSKTFQSVKYIAYIRNPAAWLVSLHGQNTRQGVTDGDFESFLDRKTSVPFSRILNFWKNAVGKDKLDVRLFNEKWLSGDGLIADFSEAIGYKAEKVARKSPLVNASFTNNSLPLLSRMQHMFRKPQERPLIGQQMRARITLANSANLDWVCEEFFADKAIEFDRWSEAPSNIQGKKPKWPFS